MAQHKILWQHFPKHSPCSDFLKEVVGCFDAVSSEIASLDNVGQVSNDVLAKVRGGLERLGFLVETSKTAEGKIKVPVLYGANGKVEKAFDLLRANGYTNVKVLNLVVGFHPDWKGKGYATESFEL